MVRLSANGDATERRYWGAFIADRFPSYETFWLERVVPLTRRVLDEKDIRFQASEDLPGADEDIAIAQLHYTTLVHLGRVHDLLHQGDLYWQPRRMITGPGSAAFAATALSATGPADYGEGSAVSSQLGAQQYRGAPEFDFDEFTEAFVRLAAASDVADELLARCTTPGTYGAWSERQGKTARWAWRKDHGDPLKSIRDYRNRLVHGRIVPRRIAHGALRYPRLDKVDDYLDWRRAESNDSVTPVSKDFGIGHVIVLDAWDHTVSYAETNWRAHLLD